ncbi:hypothetical protein KM031_21840 (plasmid) [Gemmobacter fulvus]|uniref:Uncharacterized protein n=1 Tax=Gemmobacter fulvus TaxID=2840474 RepID=A0A975PBC2_9RHOB|nr:hypothetical protein [Gemmobacter fulvus]MBT9247639.1 hypothetical protein [Gemmobacter fulvus]QWK93204.1 hypothetical protein KM031_21840 [Gemmobacter fulvus]
MLGNGLFAKDGFQKGALFVDDLLFAEITRGQQALHLLLRCNFHRVKKAFHHAGLAAGRMIDDPAMQDDMVELVCAQSIEHMQEIGDGCPFIGTTQGGELYAGRFCKALCIQLMRGTRGLVNAPAIREEQDFLRHL